MEYVGYFRNNQSGQFSGFCSMWLRWTFKGVKALTAAGSPKYNLDAFKRSLSMFHASVLKPDITITILLVVSLLIYFKKTDERKIGLK